MLNIRKIENKDIETVGRIFLKAFNHPEESLKYYKGFGDYVNFAMEQEYAYVAVVDEVCCGVILAYETPDMFCGRKVYIELLAVLPEYQKNGYAGKLFEQIVRDAKNKGMKEISIRTGCYMDSYQIYKNWGFRDSRSDCRYMVKRLKE